MPALVAMGIERDALSHKAAPAACHSPGYGAFRRHGADTNLDNSWLTGSRATSATVNPVPVDAQWLQHLGDPSDDDLFSVDAW